MLNSDAWLLLSILFFVVVFVWTIRYAIKKRSKLLDPIFIFLFFYCLYSLPFACRAYITKDSAYTTEHQLQLLGYIPFAVFLCALGLPFFVWGYYSNTAKRLATKVPVPPAGRRIGLISAFLSVISLLLILELARSSGGLLSFVLLGYNVTAEMVGKGYLAVGFSWLYVAALLLLCGYVMRKRKIYLVGFMVTFAFVLGLHLLMWRRSEMIFMILGVILFWHSAIRPITFRKLFAGGLILYLTMAFASPVRDSNYESIADFFTKSAVHADTTANENHTLVYALFTGDFYYPFETFPQVIKSVGTEVRPLFGLSYLRAPLFWIPMKIYPQRPLSLAQWYMQQFYGGGFGLNQGMAFFFLAEGYINFGPVGPLITMLFWGTICGLVQQYRIQNSGNAGAVLLYSLFVAFLLQAVRGDTTSLTVSFPAQWLGPAVIGLWATGTGKRKQRLVGRAASQTIGPAPLPE